MPPNNIWWLSRSPAPMSSFFKQIWVVTPLNPSKAFSDLPLLGSQLRLISPLVLPKIKWSPIKSPPPGYPMMAHRCSFLYLYFCARSLVYSGCVKSINYQDFFLSNSVRNRNSFSRLFDSYWQFGSWHHVWENSNLKSAPNDRKFPNTSKVG